MLIMYEQAIKTLIAVLNIILMKAIKFSHINHPMICDSTTLRTFLRKQEFVRQ